MVLKKEIKSKKTNSSSLSSANDKRGEMLVKIDSLMEKINNDYGPFILDELQKRLEFTIEEFHSDLKTVLDNAFKKHNLNLDDNSMNSESVEDGSEVPAFIAEHEKKRKNKKK